jgi:hypothetical protein
LKLNGKGIGLIIALLLNAVFGDELVQSIGGQEAVAGAFQLVFQTVLAIAAALAQTQKPA